MPRYRLIGGHGRPAEVFDTDETTANDERRGSLATVLTAEKPGYRVEQATTPDEPP